ncbi:MAG: PAS domain-containing protein [Candidatus Jettenia caeni]|nr:PAS domain-containing protein [Candidatus Jettenia caeni]
MAEQKLSEEALRTSESKYRLLLENLPQRIFYKNKDSMYISCNENYAGDIRIKPDEIRGKTDYDFFPKALAEKYRADDKRIMESGKAEEIEEKYVKDGQEYITVKTPMKDEKGAIIGILGIFWDITEKIAMEKEAIRSRHLVSLGELAASVAHEVNNPITGVINYAQILCNKSTEGSKEKDIANRIIREGDRIASIVQSLLSFARISDKKEKKSIISVHEILSDTLILTKAQLRQEGIRIKLDIPQRLPEIVADPQQIQQVFLNAISNARYALNQKYPETHDNKILEVLGEEMTIDNQQCVKITFYDHGTGIPAEIRDKIMDPFFTTKPRGKGTGLGLSISQSIIQDHHGKLTIESIEGEFTKVAIIFPVIVKTG